MATANWRLLPVVALVATAMACTCAANGSRRQDDRSPEAPLEGEEFNPVDVTPEWLNFSPRGMFIDVKTAYITAGDLHIFDFSDPSHPTRMKVVEAPQSWGGVAVSGGYAYVPSCMDCLRIIDVDPLETAHVVGSVELPEQAWNVAVSEDYAYVTCGSMPGTWSGNTTDSLQVIDISRPDSPFVVGSVLTGSGARGIEVSGDYAYIVVDSGPEIIAIRQPESPEIVAKYEMWHAKDFAFYDGNLYITTDDYFHAINVASPESPLIDRTCEIFSRSHSIAIQAGYAYVTTRECNVSDRFDSLKVLDFQSPESPMVIGSLALPTHYDTHMTIAGDRLYMIDREAGIRTIDISSPGAMRIVGHYPTTESSLEVAIDQGHAYLLKSSGIMILDVDQPESAAIIGMVETPGEAVDIAIEGDYAYVAARSGLHIVDVDPPESARIIRTVDTDTMLDGIQAVHDGYALVTPGYVIDIDPPEEAHLCSSVAMPESVSSVRIAGDFGYATSYDAETDKTSLLALKLNLPQSIDVVASIDKPWTVLGVDSAGRYGYVSDIKYWTDPCWSAGWPETDYFIGAVLIDPKSDDSIWKGGDGESVAEGLILRSLDFSGFPHSIPIVGGYAYVVSSRGFFNTGDRKLNIIDLDPPEEMHLEGSFDFNYGNLRNLAVSEGYLYVAAEGLHVLRLW